MAIRVGVCAIGGIDEKPQMILPGGEPHHRPHALCGVVGDEAVGVGRHGGGSQWNVRGGTTLHLVPRLVQPIATNRRSRPIGGRAPVRIRLREMPAVRLDGAPQLLAKEWAALHDGGFRQWRRQWSLDEIAENALD